MIRIDIPEDLIEDILSDIEELYLVKDLFLTKSTKNLFKEIELREEDYKRNKLTEEEEDIGMSLGDIIEGLSFKDEVKEKINDIIKPLEDNKLKFKTIYTTLKRKYHSQSLIQKPSEYFFNLVFDVIFNFEIKQQESVVKELENRETLEKRETLHIRCKKCFNYPIELVKELGDWNWEKDGRKRAYGHGTKEVRVKCHFCGQEYDEKIGRWATIDEKLQWRDKKKK